MIVKAANFLILGVGIALIIVGAIAINMAIVIVGDILVVGGILLFWAIRKGMLPPALGGSGVPQVPATSDAARENDDSRRDA